jgi:hypothetical protein
LFNFAIIGPLKYAYLGRKAMLKDDEPIFTPSLVSLSRIYFGKKGPGHESIKPSQSTSSSNDLIFFNQLNKIHKGQDLCVFKLF